MIEELPKLIELSRFERNQISQLLRCEITQLYSRMYQQPHINEKVLDCKKRIEIYEVLIQKFL